MVFQNARNQDQLRYFQLPKNLRSFLKGGFEMYMDQEHPDTFFVVIGRKYAYKLM